MVKMVSIQQRMTVSLRTWGLHIVFLKNPNPCMSADWCVAPTPPELVVGSVLVGDDKIAFTVIWEVGMLLSTWLRCEYIGSVICHVPQFYHRTVNSHYTYLQEVTGNAIGCSSLIALILQYRDILESNWVDVAVPSITTTEVSISAVPLGNYIFRLTLTNNDGISAHKEEPFLAPSNRGRYLKCLLFSHAVS